MVTRYLFLWFYGNVVLNIPGVLKTKDEQRILRRAQTGLCSYEECAHAAIRVSLT